MSVGSISARNSLLNHGGFSPNQLVFGQNMNLPSVLTDQLPALTGSAETKLIKEKLDTLHQARKNFIKAESSVKIKRALKHPVRTYSEHNYETGEQVFFKRKNHKGWKGPGRVLGKDGNFVLVREGKSFFRCHPCHLCKINTRDQVEQAETSRVPDGTKRGKAPSSQAEGQMSSQDEGQKTIHIQQCSKKREAQHNDTETDSDEEHLQFDGASESDEEHVQVGGAVDANEYGGHNPALCPADVTVFDNEQINRHEENQNLEENGNNQRSTPVPMAVRRLFPHNNPGVSEALFTDISHTIQIQKAKEQELEKLKHYDVYDWVIDEGQTTVSSRWITTSKVSEDGQEKVKARLVARGFEEEFEKRKDSPTISREGLRMVFIVAATMNWHLSSLDISSAFLQGNVLTRTVFVRPPKDIARKGFLWKLKRCLYGLCDAPREWYQRVSQVLIKLGGIKSLFDKCLFIFVKGDKLDGIIGIHVDDFQYCGTQHFRDTVLREIKQEFETNGEESGNFKYIGVHVEQDARSKEITIDQVDYCNNNLKEVDMGTGKKAQSQILNDEEKKKLKSAVGQVMWTTSQTRPDGSYQACQSSNYGKNPTVKLIQDTNKVIRKLKTDEMKIKYPGLGNLDDLGVVVYSDGSHATLPSGGSQGASIVFLQGHGRSAPVTWKSKKIERVTKSPLATEVSAVADGADLGHLVASMTQEIFRLEKLPLIDVRTDSKSLKEHLESDRVIRDPRLRVDTARLRDMKEKGEITVTWVAGAEQLADCLTKKSAPSDKLRKSLLTGTLPDCQ